MKNGKAGSPVVVAVRPLDHWSAGWSDGEGNIRTRAPGWPSGCMRLRTPIYLDADRACQKNSRKASMCPVSWAETSWTRSFQVPSAVSPEASTV